MDLPELEDSEESATTSDPLQLHALCVVNGDGLALLAANSPSGIVEEYPEPQTHDEAMAGPDADQWKQAEAEEIQIKLYSIIYDAIDDIKDAMEGLLAPKVEEVIVGNIEIREVFKISKVGTIAGCYVQEGKIARANKIRVIRDGIVMHTGELETLKRFKDDARDVAKGFECGIKIKNFKIRIRFKLI
jgi:hypothetical protein